MLPFSAVGEAPRYITGHNLAKKKNSIKDSGSICKQNTQFFTLEKLIDLIVTFIFIQKKFMDV